VAAYKVREWWPCGLSPRLTGCNGREGTGQETEGGREES